MTIAALIVAAGRGTRAGGGLPKQWQMLLGRTVADHTVDHFLTHPAIDKVVVVLHPDDMDRAAHWADQGVILAQGGAERAISVRNGLRALAPDAPDHVLIHDVARPCVTPAVIDRVIEALETSRAAAPAIPVTDALWRGEHSQVEGTVDRSHLWRAQTPQGFEFDCILNAHTTNSQIAADDVEIARAAGIDVQITMGDENNIKITTPGDFERAERILEQQMTQTPDIRLGNGFDVHAFGPGDQVILCGVPIPHPQGLVGHSDADVAMHAITDAIYGALADGDIGQHFPPSDPKWKGAASDIFLQHAARRARDRGFMISNIDCTLICEAPKIGPHAAAMRERIAAILSMDAGRISIKATTSERLGFAGRKEGIACMATALLVAS
jgi:2-C-methyl-D-erythritol 4-phosphate cytidylyltransferase/2-C-methyl-D-erythritol 2,4-cyclodiphosphate synthase